jgi:serine/threonine protein kinase
MRPPPDIRRTAGHDASPIFERHRICYAAGSAPLTGIGTLLGTPTYLAPERVAGQAVTPASDLYSLGVVAWECLAGAPPFTGAPVEVAIAHRDRPLPPPPGPVPAGVAALVAELTAKDQLARPGAGVVAERAGRLRDALNSRSTRHNLAYWTDVAELGLQLSLRVLLMGKCVSRLRNCIDAGQKHAQV